MGMIKGFFRLIGRIIGKILYEIYSLLKQFGRYILILLGLIILGILWLFGHILLIILTFISGLLILFLRGFAWITVKLLGITKNFGEKLGEYTESFFKGITDIFTREEQELNAQLLTIRIETE